MEQALSFLIDAVFFLGYIAFCAVKFVICVITYLINALVRCIDKLAQKTDKKKQTTVAETYMPNKYKQDICKYIKQEDILTEKDINKIEHRDMTKYDAMFEAKIKERGLQYYLKGKVEKITEENNEYTFSVNGTEEYTVNIAIKDSNEIAEMKCTCPYSNKAPNNCKHMYAALLELHLNQGTKEIIQKGKDILEDITDTLEIANRYVTNRNFNVKDKKEWEVNYDGLSKKANGLNLELSSVKSNETTKNALKQILELNKGIKIELDKLQKKEQSLKQIEPVKQTETIKTDTYVQPIQTYTEDDYDEDFEDEDEFGDEEEFTEETYDEDQDIDVDFGTAYSTMKMIEHIFKPKEKK